MNESVYVKPLPRFPYELAANFARRVDNKTEGDLELFHQLSYLAEKAYDIERYALCLRSENEKLKQEVRFLYSVISDSEQP